MRRLIIAVMFCILLSTIAYAELCQDQDEQPDLDDTYDSAAKVEYGIEDKTDHCISGKDGYTVPEGRWLREYYCDQDDKRAYKDVDCIGEGFDKCEGGKCVSESGNTQTQTTTQKTTSPTEACGNKKIDTDLGEQCDPPDSICYSDDGDIGICTRPNDAGFGGCQCDVYKGAAKDDEEPKEEIEEVEEEPEQVEEEPEEVEEEVEEEPEAEEEPKEEARAPLPTEDYNEMKGVSVTRSITNSVKSFFSWIGSWFS